MTEVNTMANKNSQQQLSNGNFTKILGFLLFLVMFAVIVLSFSKTLEGVVYNISNLSHKVNIQSVKLLDVESKQQKDMIQLLDNDEQVAHQVKVQQVQLYEQKLQLLSQEEKIKLLEQRFNALLKTHQDLMKDLALKTELKKLVE